MQEVFEAIGVLVVGGAAIACCAALFWWFGTTLSNKRDIKRLEEYGREWLREREDLRRLAENLERRATAGEARLAAVEHDLEAVWAQHLEGRVSQLEAKDVELEQALGGRIAEQERQVTATSARVQRLEHAETERTIAHELNSPAFGKPPRG